MRRRQLLVATTRGARAGGFSSPRWPGQNRSPTALTLQARARARGFDAELFVSDRIDPRDLEGRDVDAYVNTACPRIALDDSDLYPRPVLTVPEFLMAIGKPPLSRTGSTPTTDRPAARSMSLGRPSESRRERPSLGGSAFLFLGVALVGAAVATGAAQLELVVFLPVFVGGASALFLGGVVAIFVGLLLLPLAFGVEFRGSRWGRARRLTPASRSPEGSILVGPIPFFFGSWKSPSRISWWIAAGVGAAMIVAVLAVATLLR